MSTVCSLGMHLHVWTQHANTHLKNQTDVFLSLAMYQTIVTSAGSWRHSQPFPHIHAAAAWLRQGSAHQTAMHDLQTTTATHQRWTGVRLVYGLCLHDHISAMIINWVPVEACIQLQLCLLVHLTYRQISKAYNRSPAACFYTFITFNSLAFSHKVALPCTKNVSELWSSGACLQHSSCQGMEQPVTALQPRTLVNIFKRRLKTITTIHLYRILMSGFTYVTLHLDRCNFIFTIALFVVKIFLNTCTNIETYWYV